MIELKPLAIDHIEKITQWLNDPEVNKYLGPDNRNGTSAEYQKQKFLDRAGKSEYKQFAIYGDGQFIGMIALMGINKIDRNARVFIAIGEKLSRGKGIGQEAILLLAKHAFEDLNLHKLTLEVAEENIPAIRCYEKCGFAREGLLRDQMVVDGEFTNEITMALFN